MMVMKEGKRRCTLMTLLTAGLAQSTQTIIIISVYVVVMSVAAHRLESCTNQNLLLRFLYYILVTTL